MRLNMEILVKLISLSLTIAWGRQQRRAGEGSDCIQAETLPRSQVVVEELP